MACVLCHLSAAHSAPPSHRLLFLLLRSWSDGVDAIPPLYLCTSAPYFSLCPLYDFPKIMQSRTAGAPKSHPVLPWDHCSVLNCHVKRNRRRNRAPSAADNSLRHKVHAELQTRALLRSCCSCCCCCRELDIGALYNNTHAMTAAQMDALMRAMTPIRCASPWSTQPPPQHSRPPVAHAISSSNHPTLQRLLTGRWRKTPAFGMTTRHRPNSPDARWQAFLAPLQRPCAIHR